MAQNYRDASAYVLDFSKNEIYVSNTLMEYSKSIIYLNSDNRKEGALKKIYQKLENINKVLTNTDKGFNGDVSLRDALINLNSKIIYYVKNDLLNMKDYVKISELSFNEIQADFKAKEINIKEFFDEFRRYDSIKVSFAKKIKINVEPFLIKNIFEYNANQNFIFYKINVLDEKLVKAIDSLNSKEIKETFFELSKECNNGFYKIKGYKDVFDDNSLNEANQNLIQFFLDQEKDLIQLAIEFSEKTIEFKKSKETYLLNKSNVAEIEKYKSKVKEFNSLKNKFYPFYNNLQVEKNNLINSWFDTNSKFLINNTEIEVTNILNTK